MRPTQTHLTKTADAMIEACDSMWRPRPSFPPCRNHRPPYSPTPIAATNRNHLRHKGLCTVAHLRPSYSIMDGRGHRLVVADCCWLLLRLALYLARWSLQVGCEMTGQCSGLCLHFAFGHALRVVSCVLVCPYLRYDLVICCLDAPRVTSAWALLATTSARANASLIAFGCAESSLLRALTCVLHGALHTNTPWQHSLDV